MNIAITLLPPKTLYSVRSVGMFFQQGKVGANPEAMCNFSFCFENFYKNCHKYYCKVTLLATALSYLCLRNLNHNF